MRKICIFITICLSLFSLQAKEVRRPAFIVDCEPFPQGLTLRYEQPLSIQRDTYKTLFFDAAPLVINKKDQFQLFGMLGVMSDFYGGLSDVVGGYWPIPTAYLGTYIAINVAGQTEHNFVYQSYHSVGAFAAYAKINDIDAFRYFQVTTFGKKWKPTFLTSVGLLSSTRHGDPLFLPLLKITIARPKVVLDIIAPVSIVVRRIQSRNFHIVSYYKSSTAGYAVTDHHKAMQRMSHQWGIDFERHIKKWLWFKGGIALSSKTKFQALSEKYDHTFEESPVHLRGNIEIFIRPF